MNKTLLLCVLFAITLMIALQCSAKRVERFDSSVNMGFDIPSTGLGDQLVSCIGAAVIAQAKNTKLVVNVVCDAEQYFEHGRYDFMKLFQLPFTTHCGKYKTELVVRDTITAASTSPFMTAQYLQTDPYVIGSIFKSVAGRILPQDIIQQHIPSDMQTFVGIHLRKSDKVRDDNTALKGWERYHAVNTSKHMQIIEKLKEDAIHLVKNGQTKFFVCSEDKQHLSEFCDFLGSLASHVQILSYAHLDTDASPPGFRAVLDMFTLSRCAFILQGTRQSTFSILASMIGNKPLINYSLEEDKESFLHLWTPFAISAYPSSLQRGTEPKQFLSNDELIETFKEISFVTLSQA